MKKNRGFTLIEILIVMVVIGILAAIAYPAFTKQLQKSTRAGAQAVMMDIANKEQFYLQSQRQYWGCASPCSDMTPINVTPSSDVTNFYTFTIATDMTATPPTFLITATPVSGKRQVSDGALTLDSTNTKTPASKW